MQIAIQKLPDIEGDVILMDCNGNHYMVTENFNELDLPNLPESPMELLFKKYEQVFIPNGPGDEFMDSGIYTIMQLTGNELLIRNDCNIGNIPNLKWTALE